MARKHSHSHNSSFDKHSPSRHHVDLRMRWLSLEDCMGELMRGMWSDEGQDIAEYAVMLAVILVLVVGTIRLVGSNANNAFSSVASSVQ
jgi:Flp pilus assembly pilin Flp